MNQQMMLNAMCQSVLTSTDIRCIVKARGLSAQAVSSRSLLANFYLSSTGVESVLAELSRKEIVMLHLLAHHREPVDVAFFKRLYKHSAKPTYWGTYTEQHKGILVKIKEGLLRKGILLMAEEIQILSKTAKMERLRFRFPEEFECFLPSLFISTHEFAGAGNTKREVLRNKLKNLTTGSAAASGKDSQYGLKVSKNTLYIGKNEFRCQYLQQWQKDSWAKALKFKNQKHAGALVEALEYALARLESKQWIVADDLQDFLEIFCWPQPVNSQTMYTLGWEWGCLTRHIEKGEKYYRLADSTRDEGGIPQDYLTIKNDAIEKIHLKKIPYQHLEILAKISDMNIRKNQLIASPNFVKMSYLSRIFDQHPLIVWLKENVPHFCRTAETIHKRRGKQIIHNNLMVARIKDLSLKVKIEKYLSDADISANIVHLSKEFIGFPRAAVAEVEKIVKKSGHVVKRIGVK